MIRSTLFFLLIGLYSLNSGTFAQSIGNSDKREGTFKNPIISADYSDPDAIRVGEDFYLVSSSFGNFPGLPVLHSKDLVNWEIIGHAVQNYPFPEFEKPQHGNAIWAPSIRFHNNEFYIYFGDPDRGVFMTKAKNPEGPWEPLKLIHKITGWIDCCPFWDEDGSAYLVHAFANSRCGIKSILSMNKMNAEGTQVINDGGVMVFNGQQNHPTMEGPKMYKRNGYYYIFAPAGGVKTGWQTILRSKNIWGPYDDKIVLEQGSTKVNGPHQGAWITTSTGEDWFLHFQDRYTYGRVVHLQPMKWENDWPVMGIDYDKNGIGEPVSGYIKPNAGKVYPIKTPQTDDEFNSATLGLQWQWESNFNTNWYSLTEKKGSLRLTSMVYNDEDKNLWTVGSLLLQKLPAEKFTATTMLELNATNIGEKGGLLVFGLDYSYIAIEKNKLGYELMQVICTDAKSGNAEETVASIDTQAKIVYLRVEIKSENESEIIPKVICNFSYSIDGKIFNALGQSFVAKEGQWIGAKLGLFSSAPKGVKNPGYIDCDWFKISKL